MISTRSQTTFRRPQRRDPTGGEHDPAKLSASLRELAIRAYRLVRDRAGSDWERTPGTSAELSVDADQSLREVHAQIIQLQRRLRAHDLHDLAAYVSCLRQRVEEELAGTRQASPADARSADAR
jgi:hypothetical protein